MSGYIRVEDVLLRQTAFSVEQMAPGGIDRSEPARLLAEDLQRALERVDELLARPDPGGGLGRASLVRIQDRTRRLEEMRSSGGPGATLVYVDAPVWQLEPRLRSAALEVDFTFGNKDGTVSVQDIAVARGHYAAVRGPVGWNRLLLADELERRLYPNRTLAQPKGMKIAHTDWASGPEPEQRLAKMARYVDDAALARTYADVAARLAVVEDDAPEAEQLAAGLTILGREIQGRDGIRPSITDIARVGCEDPAIKAQLKTPIEMSRKLVPGRLLDPYLGVLS